MEQTNETENKMGVMPIPRLLITMALPMMISMLIQALYNVVDSIFVARLSEDALTAVSLTFPIQNLMIAIGTGTGVGINALLSRNLGEKRFKNANLAARNGIFLAILSYIVAALIGIFCSRWFFVIQTNDAEIISYGYQYMSVVTIVSFGLFMEVTFERLLQSTGKTFYTMITQGTGAIINIIMDPILIFGLFGFPRLGIRGAAVATVSGQIVAAILAIIFNIRKNKELDLNMRGFRPNGSVIGTIYKVGVPSIIMSSIGSVLTFGMNEILMMFSSTATAVYGIYFKLQSFVFMPIFGLNNGMIPIVSYNYGARNKKRILSTIHLAMGIAVGIMSIGFLIFMIFPRQLLYLFSASENMLSIGVPALRIMCICFPIAGVCIVIGSVFQALGNGVYSLIVSLSRQLIVALPVAYIFAKLFGLSMVWWCLPIAETVSLSLSVILYFRIRKQKITPLDQPVEQQVES